MSEKRELAIVTGASSGIGEATSLMLAESGFDLAICARREDKLNDIAKRCREIGAEVVAEVVDVNEAPQREEFIKKVLGHFQKKVRLLFNNAGLALGTARYAETDYADLRQMFETNVFAPHAITKLLLPEMTEDGQIIFMGSVAGHQAYEGGSGYCGSKHALRAMYESLRQEEVAGSVRFSTISPGMVNTEFSTVRFKGDKEKADRVYQGIEPLTAKDIAECVKYIVQTPAHVNVGDITLFPRHQADARRVHKE